MLFAGLHVDPRGKTTIPNDYAEGYEIEEGDEFDLKVTKRIYV